MKFWSGGDYVWVPDSSGAGPDADDYGWQEVRHWNGRWGRRYVPGGPLKAGASRKKKPVNLQAIQMINWKETKTVILVGTAITTLPVTTVIAAQTGPGGVIAVAVGRSVPLIGPVLVEGGAATEGAGAAATEAGILAGEGAAESAAATEAAAALRSTNVALGLSREAALDAFASETNAVASGGWLRAGLIGDATSTSAFPQAFRQATSNAIASGGKIRFNLQGLNLGRALSAGWSDAALYCEETGYTEWELQQILRDKALFDNTEFYMGAGRLLTQSELEALGIVFLGG